MPKAAQQKVALTKELIFPLRLHLYHLSEITLLHETTQKALFSGLFRLFQNLFSGCRKRKL